MNTSTTQIRVDNSAAKPIAASICIWDKGDTGIFTIDHGRDEHWNRDDPHKRGYVLVINPLSNDPEVEQIAYLVWPGSAYTWNDHGKLIDHETGNAEKTIYIKNKSASEQPSVGD